MGFRQRGGHQTPDFQGWLACRQQAEIGRKADFAQGGERFRLQFAVVQGGEGFGVLGEGFRKFVRQTHALPLLWGMKTIDGRVSAGSAMFFTCRTVFSPGPSAVVFQVPAANSSIGPMSSTRIMQAMTQ